MPGKDLILGTALWGWSIDQAAAFRLLDCFYAAGFTRVDTATNYPIDKNPSHFRLAERIIADWIKERRIADLRIIVKIGSLSNDGGSANDLSTDFIKNTNLFYCRLFGECLDGLWIHWDNRDSTSEIEATLAAIREISAGKPLGISGIRHPQIYAALAAALDLRFCVQVKHNLLSSALPHYKCLSERAAFYAYSLNAGGLSLQPSGAATSSARLRHIDTTAFDRLRPKLEAIIEDSEKLTRGAMRIDSLNQLNMLYAYAIPELSGMIIGPSKVEQLEETISFFRLLESQDVRVIYGQLLQALELDRS